MSTPRSRIYRGRLAPSPTGALHFGIARTFLVAWLRARKARGALVLRIEDLDPPRVVAGSEAAIAADLRWLGLGWDEGPKVAGDERLYRQSERHQKYREALAQLDGAGRVFHCSCSRKDVAAASLAPHGDLGPRYPGTCHAAPARSDRPTSIRFRMHDGGRAFVDRLHGTVRATEADDFIVRRSDGHYAYQLAVVVDDAAMDITEVVRGDDLLSSTPRQLALYDALGLRAPGFLHVPLLLGPDGTRLAKRHGAVAISEYRKAGVAPQRIIGALAASLNLCPTGMALRPSDLVAGFDPAALSTTPVRFDPAIALASD